MSEKHDSFAQKARPLAYLDVISILQSKLESLRLTLSEKEYKMLPHVRTMEETLKYAQASHRAVSAQPRELLEEKRSLLAAFPLRLVQRASGDSSSVHLSPTEVTAMLNLEPKTMIEMSILFPWVAKYEPIDVESLIAAFVACNSLKAE